MNKKILVPVVLIGVLLIIGFGYLLTKDSDKDSDNSKPASETSQTSNQSANNNSNTENGRNTAPPSQEATITFSDNGFTPASLTVKSGSTVTIKNNSNSSVQFDSDPHPAHTANPELNVGVIAAGETKTFVVNTKGTHGYHNHFDSSQTGTLVVI